MVVLGAFTITVFIKSIRRAMLYFRLFLAVLHFNENGNRTQAINSRGEKMFSVSFPRGRSGDGVAKATKIPQSFGEIMCVIL